jgi:hypothetical protein
MHDFKAIDLLAFIWSILVNLSLNKYPKYFIDVTLLSKELSNFGSSFCLLFLPPNMM